ncbi:Hypothetical predicted protein [Mytilus galloprovincialis]|uniref:CCHC-type domain-containing protein n=1 Tax=Mytilus galloprovincialis TaxID=29158 RepID=A0A8B6GG18_MYTGA|nr:Hypothetical predicted protein [Mytilus galloprovincialis]
MDPDIENSVKRIVGEEIRKTQNDLLSQMEGMFSIKLQEFDHQQKERSELQMNRLQNELSGNDDYKFQRKSCEDQFKFNRKLSVLLKEADASLESRDPSASLAKQKISEGIQLIRYRQKLVKMADSSEMGWKVVQEYTANPLADDSEDDRKILRAQTRAERKTKSEKAKKKRPTPYSRPTSTATSSDANGKASGRPGVCYNCYKPGHWKFECPEKKRKLSTNLFNVNKLSSICSDLVHGNSFQVNTNHLTDKSLKYFMNDDSICLLERERIEQVSSQLTVNSSLLTPVGKLKKSIHKWRDIDTSMYILSVIEKGYGIPFKVMPDNVILRNNKSARDNGEFVIGEILKLTEKGCISEVNDIPFVVNPLTVAFSRSKKPRLVLDCRHINECIHQFRFKFEDAEEKCVWYPQQNMTWIGLVWDMEFGKLRVSSERIDRLVDVISKILFCVGKGKMLHNAKFVAGIVGQIISMQAVLGNLVRLRTRELYNCILLRASWKSLVALTAPAVEELRYWLNSVTQLNEQGNDLHESDVCDLVAFTDASEVGFGGYIVPAVDGICAESVCDSLEILTDCCLELPGNSLKTVVGSWSVLESGKSSTWRELEAVSRTVKSSLRCLENHCLKLNTDNKNVTSIVKNGSKKPELQNIACELNYLCSENNIKIKPHWIPREQI